MPQNHGKLAGEMQLLAAGALAGTNSAILVNGAPGSGKSCVLWGFSAMPGLAHLALQELLRSGFRQCFSAHSV